MGFEGCCVAIVLTDPRAFDVGFDPGATFGIAFLAMILSFN